MHFVGGELYSCRLKTHLYYAMEIIYWTIPSIAMPFDGALCVCRVVHPSPRSIASMQSVEADPQTKCTIYHLRSNEFWKKHDRVNTHFRRYILVYEIASPVVIKKAGITRFCIWYYRYMMETYVKATTHYALVTRPCLPIITIRQKQNTTDSLAADLLLCLAMARIRPPVACSLIHFLLKYALKLAHWRIPNLTFPPELDILMRISWTCLDELKTTIISILCI